MQEAKKSHWSLISLLMCIALVWGTSFFYYPKWKASGSEATLSWDVSGYYMYLPATFIYKDIKQYAFKDDILNKYSPTPDFQQGFFHEKSGNYVMKYSSGQALMFLPAFAVGHAYASLSSEYEADGFSRPYQLAIALESLLFSLLGLFMLRKILLRFFSDKTVAITLICVVFGSNYLDYAGINGAMTHNFLFTIYTLIIWRTIRFHAQLSIKNGLLLGFLIGLAALTRPTELIAILIPLFWNLSGPIKTALVERFRFVFSNLKPFLFLGIAMALVGFIQPLYWKFVSGEWIVYSYNNQGFSWIKTHIWPAMFSHRSGWLIYSPIMFFALAGFVPLYRQKKEGTDQFSLWRVSIIFCALFMYIAFSWDEWWYGSSLGQRAMVQCYPMLAIPLAASFQFLGKAKITWLKWIAVPVVVLFVYLNLWFTHQAHFGGLLHCGNMTTAYYWKVIGTFEKDKHNLKLLDTNEEYTGERSNVKQVFSFNTPIELTEQRQYSDTFTIQASNLLNSNKDNYDWVRLNAHCETEKKEWDKWKMTQMLVWFMKDDQKVKRKFIRIQRQIDSKKAETVYIDLKKPSDEFDRIEIYFWNANSKRNLTIHKLWLETYND